MPADARTLPRRHAQLPTWDLTGIWPGSQVPRSPESRPRAGWIGCRDCLNSEYRNRTNNTWNHLQTSRYRGVGLSRRPQPPHSLPLKAAQNATAMNTRIWLYMYYYTVINIIICSHVSTILPELRSYMYITLYCAKLYIHTLFYHTGVIFYFKLYHTYYSINVFFIELYMITKYR